MIRLLIVAETRLYREGLARALDADDRFAVVGTAAALTEALELIELETTAEVLLLDHALPEGPDAVRELHRASPDLRIVAIALRETESEVLPWVEAGSVGIVGHDLPLDDLRATLAAVADGCGLCSPRTAGLLFDRVAALAPDPAGGHDLTGLTARERQIARLLDEGLSNKEIGQRLGIRVTTVKNHVHSIIGKLRVQRRGEAAFAFRGSDRSMFDGGGSGPTSTPG